MIGIKLKAQIYNAFQKMGANSELLSIIGSIGDTLSNREVTCLLSDWNSRAISRSHDTSHIRFHKHRKTKELICTKRIIYFYYDKELKTSFTEDRIEYFRFNPTCKNWKHISRVSLGSTCEHVDLDSYETISYLEVDKYKEGLIMMESLSS